MAAHFLRHHDFEHDPLIDWLLILVGALFAWLFWPATHVHH
ncbi:hypothetical protein [Geothrix alkalitolerans]|nr:hypothetical protein [Geothrix alkalitolerans]